MSPTLQVPNCCQSLCTCLLTGDFFALVNQGAYNRDADYLLSSYQITREFFTREEKEEEEEKERRVKDPLPLYDIDLNSRGPFHEACQQKYFMFFGGKRRTGHPSQPPTRRTHRRFLCKLPAPRASIGFCCTLAMHLKVIFPRST